jgi:hypothetical protein
MGSQVRRLRAQQRRQRALVILFFGLSLIVGIFALEFLKNEVGIPFDIQGGSVTLPSE